MRPYTKWEWTLPSGIVAKEVVRRAHTIMHSDPKGPVYLMLPREILTEVWSDRTCGPIRPNASDDRRPVPTAAGRQLADALLNAK